MQNITEEQYNELEQFWQEYMMLGPKRGTEQYTLSERALDFCQWIDSDPDEEPRYGLPEIMAFFAEKERRDGRAIAPENRGEMPDLVLEQAEQLSTLSDAFEEEI